jgi:hypothetical protein
MIDVGEEVVKQVELRRVRECEGNKDNMEDLQCKKFRSWSASFICST